MTWSLTLADHLPANRPSLWKLACQAGVTAAVTSIPEGPNDPPAWDFMHLLKLKQSFADRGLDLQVIESAPMLHEFIKRGAPNRDEMIGRFCELVENMGRAGIPVMCHNFMAVHGWMRTSLALPARGGALVTGYDHRKMQSAPMTEYGEITEEQLWQNMEAFLTRVIPVAEKAGVYLAVHPDDPPVSPIRGIGRILTSTDAIQRVIDMVPSPHNGITFCQGSISTMNVDVPAEIRRFSSQNAIHFVHFRDVTGTPDNFVESFHDLGRTDMFEALRAYRDTGFSGPMRVDHVPSMDGEENLNPGYETLGRLYAIGYVKGLIEGVNKIPSESQPPAIQLASKKKLRKVGNNKRQ
ncbi:mannonate dehydratase [soil metagenome]